MKKIAKLLAASAMALAVFGSMTAMAAPSHRCTVSSNQLFYFMVSVDDALDEMQQDLINNYSRDNALKTSLQSLVDVNRALHNNMGRQAMRENMAQYSYKTLEALYDAALNYYNLASVRMRNNHEHLQHAYELQWLVQEARNEFDTQCRDNRKQRDEWYHQWDQRPDHASLMNMMNQALANDMQNLAASQAMMQQMMAGYHTNPNAVMGNTQQPVVQVRPQAVIIEPMDDVTFNTLKDQLEAASFDKDKEAIIKAAAAHNYFTVTQLRDLMAAEKFDSARIIYAEAVFPRLVDKSNWFVLLKTITFDSYKKKLQDIANRNL